MIYKILNYPGIKPDMYRISEYGDIININTGKYLSERIRKGYRTTQLMSVLGKSRQYRIHRLVAYMFSEGYSDELVVNHIDGNKMNCHCSNLEWVTQKENIRHAFNNNLVIHCKRESVNTAILTEKDVRFICAFIFILNGDIQNVYNLTKLFIPKLKYQMVQNIRNGETWSDISIEYFNPDDFIEHRFDNADIELICELINKNNGNIDLIIEESGLFFKHPVSKSFIRSLMGKRAHKSISDKYFDKEKYRQRLTDDDVHIICETLIDTNMDADKTFDILSKINNRVTKQRIQDIIQKASHTAISSKYF